MEEENQAQQANTPTKNSWWLGLIIGVIFLAIFGMVLGTIFGSDSDTNSSSSSTSQKQDVTSIINPTSITINKKLQLTNIRMTIDYNSYLGYSAKITGTAKNISGKDLSYASVSFSVYDGSSNNLGSAMDNINNLRAGDTWQFEATLFDFPKTKPVSYKFSEITAW